MTEWIKGSKVLLGYWWMKELKNDLNWLVSLKGVVGGQAWMSRGWKYRIVYEAFCLTETWLSFPKTWMNFSEPQIEDGKKEGMIEFKIFPLFLWGTISACRGEEVCNPLLQLPLFSLAEVEPPIGYSTCTLNLALEISPASSCLCFDFLSAPGNLFCSEWETGMSARVSARLINNDRIYHSAVCEVTLLVTRWGNLFHSNHE